MEEYWHNNRDFIVQSTRGIYQWILLHIKYGLVVWGYLEDPIVVDVQNAHMICTKCYVVSSYYANDVGVVGGVLWIY